MFDVIAFCSKRRCFCLFYVFDLKSDRVKQKVLDFYLLKHTQNVSTNNYLQVAQLSQRDRAAGWVSFGQKWKTGTGRQYLLTV